MKSKLNYLIRISLNRKIKTKWFAIANILLAIVIVGVINVDSIITFFGGDFNQKYTVYVTDKTNGAYDLFKQQMDATSSIVNNKGEKEESDYIIEPFSGTEEDAKKMIEEKGKKFIFVTFEPSTTNTVAVKVISKEYLDMINTQILTNAINNTKVSLALSESDISMEELNEIYKPVEIVREYLDEEKNSTDENMEIIMTTVFPVIILPFFMLSIFLVQMIGAEVNDEKTTRGMEIIISNVSPKTHFFAKVIAGNLFVLIQGLLLVLSGGLGLLIRKLIGGNNIMSGLGSEVGNVLNNFMSTELGSKLIYIVPLVLLLMVLTFVGYSLLAGILASMTTNIEDFQQLQTPIIVVSLIGYYLAMMAGVFEGALFIKVLAFVPFISAILAPSLLVLGQFGLIEFFISILLMVGTIYLLIKYGLKIYKVGILNYSSKDLWKKMFKAIKS